MNEIRISVAIMGVMSRLKWIREIQRRLHPLEPAVVVDTNHSGVWWSAKKAWLSFSEEATHHIVLQDDAIPCSNFLECAYGAISARPDAIISFYAGHAWKSAFEYAEKHDYSWFITEYGISGVAIAMPVEMIRRYILFTDMGFEGDWWHDDNKLKIFQYINGYYTYYTVPELVFNAGFNDSLLGHVQKISSNYKENPSVNWSKGLAQDKLYLGDMKEQEKYIKKFFTGKVEYV